MMYKKLINISWNHRNAEINFRDKLSMSPKEIIQLNQTANRDTDIIEFTVLSTCNRMEFYVVTTNPDRLKSWVFNQYNLLFKRNLDFETSMPKICLGMDVVKHLFRVSAGMESIIIGEKQILNQVQSVWEKILKKKENFILLDHLFAGAVRCGKSVHDQTQLGSEERSISWEIVKKTVEFSSDITIQNILIIGAGETAELTAQHFIESGAKHITISNRSIERGKFLAERLKIDFTSFIQITDILRNMDIVITATDSMKYLIRENDIKIILCNGKNKERLFIDISSPRNIDPGIRKFSGITLLDIDSLKIRYIEGMGKKVAELSSAEKIVQLHVKQYCEKLHPQQDLYFSNNEIHPIQLEH